MHRSTLAGWMASTWRTSSAPIEPAPPVISTRLPDSAGAQAATSSWTTGRASSSSGSKVREAAMRSAVLATDN